MNPSISSNGQAPLSLSATRRKLQRGWKALLAICLSLFGTSVVQAAGYVWTENGSGSYAGTSAPWVSNDSYTGKWVTVGDSNVFTSDVNVTGGTNLTIDGATVSVASTQVVRVEQGTGESTLTIQNGGKLILANSISVSDKSGASTGNLVIDNGTLSSTSEVRIGFHWTGNLSVNNGGVLETTGILYFGGQGARKGKGYGRIGSLDDLADTGSIQAAAVVIGGSGEAKVTLNRGSISSNGNITIGDASVIASGDSTPLICELNVNSAGMVTAKGDISLANLAGKQATLRLDGGTVSANRIHVGDAGGEGFMVVDNNGYVNATERIVVGQRTTGTLTLNSGTILVGALSESSTVYKSFYLGGSPDVNTQTGNGTAKINGGELLANGIYVGYAGTGALEITNGTITGAGELNVGYGENVSGTISQSNGTITAGGALNVGYGTNSSGTISQLNGTFTAAGALNVGYGKNSSGTISRLNGTFTATGKTTVGYQGEGELSVSGGTLHLNGGLDVGSLAGSEGTVKIGSANSSNTVTATIGGTTNIGLAGMGAVIVENATLTLAGELNIGASNSTAASPVTGLLEVGKGGLVIAPKIIRLTQQQTGPGTLTVKDGGEFRHTGTDAFNVGDNKTGGVAYVNVDGAGSLIISESVGINLGYHGTVEAVVSNGGTIRASSIALGVNNSQADTNIASLTISGPGSLVKTTNTFSLGSNTRQSVLDFVATSGGFGLLDVGSTLTWNKTKGSEVQFHLNHGVAMLNSAEAVHGYEVIKAASISGWSDFDYNIWSASQANGIVTVKLNDAKKSASTVVQDQGFVVVDPSLGESGWIKVAPDGYYDLTILTTGLNTTEATDLFSEWIEAGNNSYSVETLDANLINISTFSAADALFAWDFSNYSGATVALAGIKSNTVPEPSTWALLFVSIIGLGVIGRRRLLNRRTVQTDAL